MLARFAHATLAAFAVGAVGSYCRICALSELAKGMRLVTAVYQHQRKAARGDQSLQLLTAVEHRKPFEHAETFYFTIGIIGKTTPVA